MDFRISMYSNEWENWLCGKTGIEKKRECVRACAKMSDGCDGCQYKTVFKLIREKNQGTSFEAVNAAAAHAIVS